MRTSEEQRKHANRAGRRHFRVRWPLDVNLSGASYVTDDWSTSGLKIGNFRAPTYVGKILTIAVSIPNADSDITFKQKTRVVRLEQKQAKLAVKFIGLGDRRRRLLHQLSEYWIIGKIGTLVTDDNPLREASVSAESLTESYAPAQIAVRKTGRKTTLKSATYSIAGLTFCSLVAIAIYFNLFRVQIDSAVAYVSRQILTSSSNGFVSAILAAPGELIVKGDAIMQLENFKLRDDLVLARNRLNTMIENAIEHEKTLNQTETKLRVDPSKNRQNQTGADQHLKSDLKRLSLNDQLTRRRLSPEIKKLRGLLQQIRALTLRAPFTGRIVEIFKPKGSRVKPADPLVIMEGHKNPMLETYLTRSEADHVRIGQLGVVNLLEKGLRYPAEVIKIDKAPRIANYADAGNGWAKTDRKSFRVILKLNEFGDGNHIPFLSPDQRVSVSLQKQTVGNLIAWILSRI